MVHPMKTYTFFILSLAVTVNVQAFHKSDALEIIVHQFNIHNSDSIKCLGINLEEAKNG